MSEINFKFQFHNVGQGLFYSAKIDDFSMVYDCGAEKEKYLKSNIIQFPKNDVLDLLVISHFHKDHINGIIDLLETVKTVENLVIPYFPPYIRILYRLNAKSFPEWYYDFLFDPVSFFLSIKEVFIKRIIIMSSPDEGDSLGSIENIPFPDIPNTSNDNDKYAKFWKEFKDNEKLIKSILANEEPEIITHESKKMYKWIQNGKLLVKEHLSELKIHNWIFKFYNCSVNWEYYKEFKTILENDSDLNFSNLDEFKEILKTKSNLNKFQECYKKLYKSDFNNTSLILYHGPYQTFDKIEKLNIECLCRNRYFSCDCFPFKLRDFSYLKSDIKNVGTFLTGDIDFKKKIDEIVDHYKNYLKNIVFFQVPHHGAESNWTNAIFHYFSHDKNILFIIPAGISNKYGHPSTEIIEEIINRQKVLCWVNEFCGLQMELVIVIQ